jgi:MT0933-like antitoxin protein
MPNFFDGAKKLASEHSDIADKGLDEAAKQAEQRTGNKYNNQIEEGEEKLEGFLGVHVEEENR